MHLEPVQQQAKQPTTAKAEQMMLSLNRRPLALWSLHCYGGKVVVSGRQRPGLDAVLFAKSLAKTNTFLKSVVYLTAPLYFFMFNSIRCLRKSAKKTVPFLALLDKNMSGLLMW